MKTIVVVDDEYDIAEAVQSLLQGEGYHVVVYGDGATALAELSEKAAPVDLMLVDVMMPRLDGVKLVDALRKQPAFERVPIVLMSALRPKEAGSSVSWSAFLQKPFAYGTLLRTVERLVDGH